MKANSSYHFWNYKFRVYWNFASLFVVMKEFLCIFLGSALHNFDKNSPSKGIIGVFEWLGENSPNSSWHTWNQIPLDTEQWCKIWRKSTNLLFQKWQEFAELWSEHTKVSKICTFIGVFCAKYLTST